MNYYFYAKNNFIDRSVIDETYKNYVLSRKVLAKNLPIVTVSESAGYAIKGSAQMRKIELQGDEFFAAVGRDYNKRLVHYVFDCFKSDNGSMKAEHFVCSAQYIRAGIEPFFHPDNWIDSPRTETTGIQPYDVPDDLCVYIFSKTTGFSAEKAGFQILSATGNVIFDSRYKYLDVICNGYPIYSEEFNLINTKKVAIASSCSGLCFGMGVASSGGYLMNDGAVLFEKNYTNPTGTVYPTISIGAGARILDYNQNYHIQIFGRGTYYFVIDVNGF